MSPKRKSSRPAAARSAAAPTRRAKNARAKDAPEKPEAPVQPPPDDPGHIKPPVRRAPDAPSEGKPPIRRAPDAPGPPGKYTRGPATGAKPTPTPAAPRPRARARAAAGLELVPRASRVPGAATPPSFPQRAGGTPKQLLMFELVRARAQVHAALQGVMPGAAEQSLGRGKWTIRETALHLVARDRARLRELEAALHGVPGSWVDFDDEETARANAEALAPLRQLGWEQTLRMLQSTRQELMQAIEAVPEEPAEVWGTGHAFGGMLHLLPVHDRHHAELIKVWRANSGR